MEKQVFYSVEKQIPADTVTPVSVYLRIRNLYPKSIMLESSDYHGSENAWSFICLEPVACFVADRGIVTISTENGTISSFPAGASTSMEVLLDRFFRSFEIRTTGESRPVSGLFGYMSYDSVPCFENIGFDAPEREDSAIPDITYCFYKYIIAIDHHRNLVRMVENLREGEPSSLDYLRHLLVNMNFMTNGFRTTGDELPEISDASYMQMVSEGKRHCRRGDVFQVVLSRRYSQPFEGDDFNVYRSLRSVNPSPYLFYFDYGRFRIFGSSPEAQIRITGDKATIYPIAGTFRRTGNDEEDKEAARRLCLDPKENAEHVMLVDLARNDLSRNANDVRVETFREVQYYSHVIHLVSKVTGKLPPNANLFGVMAGSFPAGTLSGAPKYKAMKLIDKYETGRRGFYGGCIGYVGFDQIVNHAIIIRSFLSKNNRLYYQGGAGITADSSEENELQEVNNKLAALRKALVLANTLF